MSQNQQFLPSVVFVSYFVTVTRRDANLSSSFLLVFVPQVSPSPQHIHTGLLLFLHIKPWSFLGVSHVLFSLAGTSCPPSSPSSGPFMSFRSEIRCLSPSLLCLTGSLLYSTVLFWVPKTYSFSLSYICLLLLERSTPTTRS